MIKGVSLVPGTIVVLSLDGTLVYVEDIQPTFAAVVALPEQLDANKAGVFVPGKVGAKKISPFSSADKHVHKNDLSARNREFVDTYGDLRMAHGPHYVQRTPEEQAVHAQKVPGVRAQKRAAKRATAKAKLCSTCGQQSGHPNHPDDHAFVQVPVASATTIRTRAPRAEVTSTKGDAIYTLLHEDLTVARATPRGDKYNEGNRFHRVVLALASLPDKRGTVAEVITAFCTDGKTPPNNPLKVVRRALNQLTKTTFGSCVATDAPSTDLDPESDE